MGLQIESGTGSGKQAGVTDDNKLRTYSTTESEISYESETNGQSYIWSAYVAPPADDNVIWLRNDSTTQNLIIEQIIIGSLLTSVQEIFIGTGTAANGAGYATVTGVNLNAKSGKVALATCNSENGNADAGGSATLSSTHFVPATGTIVLDVKGSIILGYLDEISINTLTNTTVAASIVGYYHEAE